MFKTDFFPFKCLCGFSWDIPFILLPVIEMSHCNPWHGCCTFWLETCNSQKFRELRYHVPMDKHLTHKEDSYKWFILNGFWLEVQVIVKRLSFLRTGLFLAQQWGKPMLSVVLELQGHGSISPQTEDEGNVSLICSPWGLRPGFFMPF